MWISVSFSTNLSPLIQVVVQTSDDILHFTMDILRAGFSFLAVVVPASVGDKTFQSVLALPVKLETLHSEIRLEKYSLRALWFSSSQVIWWPLEATGSGYHFYSEPKIHPCQLRQESYGPLGLSSVSVAPGKYSVQLQMKSPCPRRFTQLEGREQDANAGWRLTTVLQVGVWEHIRVVSSASPDKATPTASWQVPLKLCRSSCAACHCDVLLRALLLSHPLLSLKKYPLTALLYELGRGVLADSPTSTSSWQENLV